MRRLPLRQSILMLIAIIVLIIVVLFAFVTVPMIFRIQGLNAEIHETQLFLETQYEKTRQLKRSINELPSVTVKVAPFVEAFTEEESEIDLITLLEDLATTYNITQSPTISFNPKGSAPPIPKFTSQYLRPHYEISLTARGSFENLMVYMDAIERLPLYMIIDAIELSSNGSTPGENMSLRFTARIFLRKIAI